MDTSCVLRPTEFLHSLSISVSLFELQGRGAALVELRVVGKRILPLCLRDAAVTNTVRTLSVLVAVNQAPRQVCLTVHAPRIHAHLV